jgi:hypothetical protein
MSGLAYVTLPDGSQRRLGNNRPPAAHAARAFPEFGATPTTTLIPRSQWDGLIAAFSVGPDFPFLPPVHDQDGVGQCNCDDTTALIESCRMEQGLPHVQLSAADLYDRINGGADNGSMLEDAMHEALVNGVGTAATSGTIWRRGMRQASAAERARFRVLEALTCPTFDHCMSAVLQGFKLSTGIVWCDNYDPDADGWLPGPGSDVGGHAIFGYKPQARATRGGTQYGIGHQNSWGVRWGLAGRFVIPEVAYSGGMVGGWWAVRSVVDEGGVVPPA